jgi:hypothetical protein
MQKSNMSSTYSSALSMVTIWMDKQRETGQFQTTHLTNTTQVRVNSGALPTSSSALGFRSTAENPCTLDEGQNWKFNLREKGLKINHVE